MNKFTWSIDNGVYLWGVKNDGIGIYCEFIEQDEIKNKEPIIEYHVNVIYKDGNIFGLGPYPSLEKAKVEGILEYKRLEGIYNEK